MWVGPDPRKGESGPNQIGASGPVARPGPSDYLMRVLFWCTGLTKNGEHMRGSLRVRRRLAGPTGTSAGWRARSRTAVVRGSDAGHYEARGDFGVTASRSDVGVSGSIERDTGHGAAGVVGMRVRVLRPCHVVQ